MGSFQVYVVKEGTNPVVGVPVRLEFRGHKPGMSAEKRTDINGSVQFNYYEESEVEIFIAGRDCGAYKYKNGESITIKT